MSMNLHVYVGPYIEAWNFTRETEWEFDHLITDGRGEAGSSDDHRFLIPSQKLPGVDRQMTFARDEPTPVLGIPAISHETYRLQELARPFLDEVRDQEGEAVMQWGVVCGWY